MLERVGTFCAWIPVPIALIVLLGYVFGIEAMTRLFLNSVFMSPNTALILACLSFGLLIKLNTGGDSLRVVVSKVLVMFGGAFATAVLLEYLLGVNFGIDLLLFPAMVRELFTDLGSVHIGRFALITAVTLTCQALAILALGSPNRRERLLSEYLGIGSIVISAFFMTVYLYGAEVPQAMVRSFAVIAPHTALATLMLGIAILFTRPSPEGVGLIASRSLGGAMLARLLPVALLLPMALSFFNLRNDQISHEFSLALTSTLIATVFGGVVWWTARQLDQFDNANREQQRALGESEERFRNIVDTANEGIWLLDMGARTSYVNKRLQEMLGYSAAEMMGRPLYDFVSAGSAPEAERHFASRVEGKVESYDFQFQTKDGGTLWAIVNSTPLKDSAGHFNGVLKMVTDITERKQAEEELLRSTEALERAQQVAHIGSWEWDVASDKLTWSDEMYRIYGIDKSHFVATFETYSAAHHPDDRERMQRIVGKALEEGSSFHFEHRIIRPDGQMRYLDALGECLVGADGKVVIMRGTGQDITERKSAELALREAQEHFQSVLDNAGMPIMVKDLGGRYLLANSDAAEALGLTSATEMIGKTDKQLVPEMADRIRATDLETSQSEDSLSVEEELPGSDGPRQFWTTKFPMRDAHGTVVGVGVISQEITELRRAEYALRESESRNRSILEAALDAVVSMNVEGKITSWNKQAEELFGWSALEAIGQPMTIIIPERYREAHINGMQHFRSTGEAPVLGKVLQLEAKHRGGREFPIDLAIGQGKSGSGDVAFSAFIRDITERKRAEQEVRDQSQQLEVLNNEMQLALQELANSHQLLQDQAAALERSNSDLDDFAYIASHDLKEPLRGISNYAHFLKEDYAEKLDEEGRNMLETLPRLTKRLETLLDALLKYSRLNRAEVVPLPTDLDDVITDVKEMLEARIKEGQVEIRIPEPLPTIMCDRSQTTEIFLNLISNGIKYNEAPLKLVEVGYVKDSESDPLLASSNGFSSGSGPASGSNGVFGQRDMIFYVSDNGIGIPEKHQDTVFGAFRRLHSRDKYGGGTGVGLAIVKKMVERQGGRIWVESEPGQGSTFYFTLNPDVLPQGGVS